MRLFAALLSLLLPVTSMAVDPDQALAWLKSCPPPPKFLVPAQLADWQPMRDNIRATLHSMLGDLPPRPDVRSVRVLSRKNDGSHWLETIEFDNQAGETVTGYCFIPKTASASNRAPAILYCHWHGDQYDIGKDEMLGTNATPVPPGPTLAAAGYVVLGIDACGFGARNGRGPDGPAQRDSNGEMTAAKFNLWMGRTLWGMIIRDDLTALDYLSSRPEVNAARVGVTGISMGSTRAWWIMALDDRPRAAVCAGCMTRYQDLIAQGKLKAHGIYYFVPGMLRHFDTEAIIACAAPRPMLFMTGDEDSGSPVEGMRRIGQAVEKVYDLHGDDSRALFENQIYPGIGHVYLPEMWAHTLEWMRQHL